MRSPHWPRALGVGQRLAQACGRLRQSLGDLGVAAQRLVDLAEPLGALLGQAGDHPAQLLELGAHLDAHLVEPACR